MKKKEVISKNYLEKIPACPEAIAWTQDEQGKVTLDIENTGWMNRFAQRFFHKPKVSHIHLDEMGSFIWPRMDGKKDLIALGKEVQEHFGDQANPLYERLAKFFQVLDSYGFVHWVK